GRWRDARRADPRPSDRVAATLGIALGVCFVLCFLTGLVSHLVQHPSSWFAWRPRPAGLYRWSQGVHVATGIATVPLLFGKLWSVFPRVFQWPLATSVTHALERLSILPLVGGSLFMLVTGVANIELWYPWVFFFPAAHFAVSFVLMGSLLIHLAAKSAIARRALRRSADDDAGEHPGPDRADATSDRRRFLGATAALSAGLVAVTAGQTVWPLRKLALLAPRRPDIGTQGFPVNKTAREAGVADGVQDPGYTLRVDDGDRTARTFTLDELRAMPMHTATLPIACVEGWSANRRWTGVAVRDVLAASELTDGALSRRSVSVESLQRGGRYRRSTLTASLAADDDTLLALFVDGAPLHPDHGYPLRLIAPNRPGVLQTKWVAKLVVR
ncbi:MAG: molybdopterin-dependent oxidoreductase, partial [Ilumatobacteraceae bacterium]